MGYLLDRLKYEVIKEGLFGSERNFDGWYEFQRPTVSESLYSNRETACNNGAFNEQRMQNAT